ncbi:TRAP transporter substrate-binding protein [uncultured Roseicyclus sp.]|jgi:TRAP-type transport system periplasmic protein|uniref:TRAP transporter substrate-binding protein n=1 Tax=uncultured Roseicyclus sp. TaxID=543072 RepID=UPI00262F006F|nr:TRAP transporter substrate-binding protein [uncultured Roseicyclus sp.]
MHYSRSIKAAIASTVFGAVTTVGMTAAMAQTELRLHTFVPPGHIIYTTILEPLAEQIAAESNGTLTLTLYPAMQLGGGAPELIRQAVEGTVDMAFSLPGYTSAQFPRTQMIELPSLRAEGMATTELMWDLLEGGYLDPEFDGLKVLALWAADDAGLYTRDKPIRSLDDVAGLLLRSPSAAQAGQIERMGGTPVAMPIPELYPQLERGVIDGALVPFTTILDFRMHEVANYFTITGPLFGRSQFTVVMNEASYNNLSAEHQAIIDRLTGEELSRKATQAYLDRAAEATDFVRNAPGKEVIEFSAEEQARIREVLAPIYAEWVAAMSAQGIDGAAMLAVAGITVN